MLIIMVFKLVIFPMLKNIFPWILKNLIINILKRCINEADGLLTVFILASWKTNYPLTKILICIKSRLG